MLGTLAGTGSSQLQRYVCICCHSCGPSLVPQLVSRRLSDSDTPPTPHTLSVDTPQPSTYSKLFRPPSLIASTCQIACRTVMLDELGAPSVQTRIMAKQKLKAFINSWMNCDERQRIPKLIKTKWLWHKKARVKVQVAGPPRTTLMKSIQRAMLLDKENNNNNHWSTTGRNYWTLTACLASRGGPWPHLRTVSSNVSGAVRNTTTSDTGGVHKIRSYYKFWGSPALLEVVTDRGPLTVDL